MREILEDPDDRHMALRRFVAETDYTAYIRYKITKICSLNVLYFSRCNSSIFHSSSGYSDWMAVLCLQSTCI